MSKKDNMRRSQRISAILVRELTNQGATSIIPDEADVIDLLADIMHYCQFRKISFLKLYELAVSHYSEERIK